MAFAVRSICFRAFSNTAASGRRQNQLVEGLAARFRSGPAVDLLGSPVPKMHASPGVVPLHRHMGRVTRSSRAGSSSLARNAASARTRAVMSCDTRRTHIRPPNSTSSALINNVKRLPLAVAGRISMSRKKSRVFNALSIRVAVGGIFQDTDLKGSAPDDFPAPVTKHPFVGRR